MQVHVRGTVSGRLRKILKEFLPSTQKIQVHYFTGDRADLEEWMDAFPNVHFSVSGSILGRVSEGQKAALRAMPKDKLLLESDSPIRGSLGKFNTPYQVGAVGLAVARILGMPHQGSLLQQTLENSRRFFNI